MSKCLRHQLLYEDYSNSNVTKIFKFWMQQCILISNYKSNCPKKINSKFNHMEKRWFSVFWCLFFKTSPFGNVSKSNFWSKIIESHECECNEYWQYIYMFLHTILDKNKFPDSNIELYSLQQNLRLVVWKEKLAANHHTVLHCLTAMLKTVFRLISE